MALLIEDERVREMAERLAEARHTTVDEAVRQALERALAREDDRAERDRAIRESWARLDTMPHYDFHEDDIWRPNSRIAGAWDGTLHP